MTGTTSVTTSAQTTASTVPPPSVQFQQAVAAANTAFVNSLVQTEVANDLLGLDATTQADTASAAEGLVSLDTPTLALLNDIATTVDTSISGSLTPQQLLEIEILQQDALGLEAAASSGALVPLSEEAATLDLSLAARSIANGTGAATASTAAAAGTGTNINANATATATTPTQAELQLLASILQPLETQALTPVLLVQLQMQLVAAGLSPQLLSLSTVVLAQNFMAAHQKTDTISNGDDETVMPVTSSDKAAAEDSTILT